MRAAKAREYRMQQNPVVIRANPSQNWNQALNQFIAGPPHCLQLFWDVAQRKQSESIAEGALREGYRCRAPRGKSSKV